MAPKTRRKKKDEPPTPTSCKNCEVEIDEEQALDCDLCAGTVCISCSSVPIEVFNFITENEYSIPILCQVCKDEIPHLREIKGIKVKQEETDKQIIAMKAETVIMKETMNLQGEEIKNHTEQLAALAARLTAQETNVNPTGPTYANILGNPNVNTEISSIVRTEVSERAEIDKLRQNLVVTGIEETNNDATDMEKVKTLLEEALDITLDLESTERIGRNRDVPRLLRLKFITQRSRKELLSKSINLRNSENNHTKTNVYVRPDLTKRQQEESKNLRDLLRKTREDNRNHTYKIKYNKIICTSLAENVEPQGE